MSARLQAVESPGVLGGEPGPSTEQAPHSAGRVAESSARASLLRCPPSAEPAAQAAPPHPLHTGGLDPFGLDQAASSPPGCMSPHARGAHSLIVAGGGASLAGSDPQIDRELQGARCRLPHRFATPLRYTKSRAHGLAMARSPARWAPLLLLALVLAVCETVKARGVGGTRGVPRRGWGAGAACAQGADRAAGGGGGSAVPSHQRWHHRPPTRTLAVPSSTAGRRCRCCRRR